MSNVISVATELGNNLLNIGSSIKNFFTGDGGLEDNVSDFNRELIKLEKQLLATSKGSKQREDLNKKIAKTRNLIKKETLALKNNNKQKTRLNKGTQQLNKKLKEQAKQHNEVAKGLTKASKTHAKQAKAIKSVLNGKKKRS